MALRKFILPALALLALSSLAGFFYKFYLNPIPASKANFVSYEYEANEAPPLIAMNEDSGELSRIVKRDAKTNLPISIEVGYHDGRKGLYQFRNGRLKSYQAFNQEGLLFFDACYEHDGSFSNYKTYFAGKLSSEFRRLPDGSEDLLYFNQDGYCIKSVVTASDGSQRTSTRTDPSKAAELTSVDSVLSERKVGRLQIAESELYRFTFKVAGARINEWEYRDSKGSLKHRGRFLGNDTIEITFVSSSGNPDFRQTWQACGEDWHGRIYRLSSIEKLSYDGSPSSSISFYTDGRTPKEICNYYNGHKTSSELVDRNGYVYRNEYHDSNGFSNGGYDVQPQFRRRVKLPPEVISEARDEKGQPVYRLSRAPFGSPASADGSSLIPLFVLPK